MKIQSKISELPVHTYEEVMDTGDLRLLYSGWLPSRWFGNQIRKAWNKIDEDIITEMLKDDDYRSSLEGDRRDFVTASSGIISGNSAKKLRGSVAFKNRIKEMEEGLKADISDTLAEMQLQLPYQIDKRKMSVKEFIHTILKLKQRAKSARKVNQNEKK